MVYGTQITIVNGVYKPTYNWGAPHCIYVYIIRVFEPTYDSCDEVPSIDSIEDGFLLNLPQDQKVVVTGN